jgi:alanine-glyoxylate transaminase/serine-glyoxylate transaminase/serine-pyruvate transaminase
VANFYLDLTLLRKYWGAARAYHHTAPINNVYALRESLRLVSEEGLQARWERHRQTAGLFWDGLAALGLECHVEDVDLRLPSLTTVRVPEGVDAKAVARQLLETYNIEIAGGFGQLAGKVWRIGLMGYNSRRENVVLLLEALRRVLD